MILLAFFLVVFAVAIGLARAARHRPATVSDVKTAVVAGILIAVVRLAVFWMAIALRPRPDWRPLVAYALLLFSASVELAMASWARNLTGWSLIVSALIVVTSFLLGWAWARLASPRRTV